MTDSIAQFLGDSSTRDAVGDPQSSRMSYSSSKKVSHTVADPSRERPRCAGDPSRRLLAAIRRYQKYASRPGVFAGAQRRWAVFMYRVWSVITGAEIGLSAQIGGGLLI